MRIRRYFIAGGVAATVDIGFFLVSAGCNTTKVVPREPLQAADEEAARTGRS